MARRSYQQQCGLAVALDIVAQRWALLIVRDLKPGPRRFSDMMAGLPGISTDVLAQRLRDLVEAGAVEQFQVSTPAPAALYRLTQRGLKLAAIIEQLGQWGLPLLGSDGGAGRRRNARWVLQSFAVNYRGGLSDGSYVLVVDGQPLTLLVGQDSADLRYGEVETLSVPRWEGSTEEFFATLDSRGAPLSEPEWTSLFALVREVLDRQIGVTV